MVYIYMMYSINIGNMLIDFNKKRKTYKHKRGNVEKKCNL